jgi:GT2 family glycosyltransferase
MTRGGVEALDLSIIIVSYNTGPDIALSLAQLEEATTHLDAEIIVVDNDSKDDTVEVARGTIERGRVIATGENLGFGGGVNVGLRVARGRHTLFMNDDAVIDAESLDLLRSVLDSSPEIAMVGPEIVNEHGGAMPSWRSNYPGPREELSRVTRRLPGYRRRMPGGNGDPFDVAWLVGACVLADTGVLRRQGGFNPEFFFYAEDIDLSRRLRTVGYRLMTVPKARAVHIGGVATEKVYVSRERSGRQTQARTIYYRLWYSRPTRSLIYLSRAIGFTNQPWRARTYLSLAINDGPTLRASRFPKPIPPPRHHD